jgi:hypothetical protein
MKLKFVKRDEHGNEIGANVDMLPTATAGNFEAVRRWYKKRGFVEVTRKRRPTKRAPDAGDSAASQTFSPQSGESTPEVESAAPKRGAACKA